MTAQYLTGQEHRVKLNNAKRLLESAIELDSRFSDAYSSMGSVYIDNLFRRNSRNPEIAYSILDSGRVFVDKALQYNPGNPAALRLKGSYYQKIGNHKEAAKLIEASFKDRTQSFCGL